MVFSRSLAHSCTFSSNIKLKGFKVLTSNREYDVDPLKCAFGVHYQLQLEVLDDLMHLFNTLKFTGGRKKFQYGGLITARATLWTHKTLKDTYGVNILLVERVNQDYVERQFSIYRGMGSADTNPSALHLLYRVQRHTTSVILDVKN